MSPHRAKLSVHMIAQATPKEFAGSMTPAEQKTKFIHMLCKYLTAMGLHAETELLETRLKDVNVADGDKDGIIKTIRIYLSEDIDTPEDQTSKVLEQL